MSLPVRRRRGERSRAEDHAQLLASLANQPFRSTSELLTSLEGERVVSLPEAARFNDTSVDTLKRRHAGKIVRMSDKRVGMRLKDVLALAQPLDTA